MLSRTHSLLLLGALLIAGPASALTLVYDMTGSSMRIASAVAPGFNGAVPVTGTMTLEDDQAGHVTITSMSLAHASYEISQDLDQLSLVITRTNITLSSGPVAGTGSTTSGASFPDGSFPDDLTTLAQTGTLICTGSVACSNIPFISGALTSPLGLPFGIGDFTFDSSRNFVSNEFLYPSIFGDVIDPVEHLKLVGTLVPEPGTGLLMFVGLLGLAGWRRARA